MEAKTEGHVVDRANLRLRRSIERYSTGTGGRQSAVDGLVMPSDQPEAAVRGELSLNEHCLLRSSIQAILHAALDHHRRATTRIRLKCFEHKFLSSEYRKYIVR